MIKLYGVQIAHGYCPEARDFALLLSGRSANLDAQVLMHSYPTGDPAFARFASVARCTMVPLDTGWRRNTIGRRRNLGALAAIHGRFWLARRKIVADALGYDPDIVYSGQQHYDLVAASRVADSLKKPQIVHLHYTIGPYLKSHALARLRTCDHVITVSDYISRCALVHGVAQERITRIYNPMDPMPELASTVRDEVRAELGIPADAFLYGIVCRLDPRKNHAHLIVAFAEIAKNARDAWLLIVGSGSPLDLELKALAERTGFGGRIVFAGYRKDVPRLHKAMDVFVHPARGEAFGLAVGEASASGLPVIGYAHGAMPEMVIDGKTGLIPKLDDVGGLADAMRALYGDPSKGADMGRAGRAHVAATFRNEIVAPQFETTIARILGVRQPSSPLPNIEPVGEPV